MSLLLTLLLVASACEQTAPKEILVSSREELVRALDSPKPGTTILIAPGGYQGGLHFSNVHGTSDQRITVCAQVPDNPPIFTGGGSGLQFSAVSFLTLENLVIKKASGNGLNIDDGGDYQNPSKDIIIRKIKVSDLPRGNNDGIKLSGVDSFLVEDCTLEKWGGSGIDMVGCHHGLIQKCSFTDGGDSGIQAKGGSAQIVVNSCTFTNAGQRGLNIGGSTGREFFRPPLTKTKEGFRYEAVMITVEGCTFRGGTAAVAFVGAINSVARFNTIYQPERWAVRILQETNTEDFLPTQSNAFEDNLIVFLSTKWGEGGVNVGPGTKPSSFVFDRNFWYCSDTPSKSGPTLPVKSTTEVIGVDPLLDDRLLPKPGSPAGAVGAHAFKN